jgi:hypothetical protein
MEPWFRMYLDALPRSKARVQAYYKFDDAAVFPETMYFWGFPNNNDYGWGNKEPEPANPSIKRYWTGNLELIAVMLDRYDFTQDAEFARGTLLPLADPLVAFFDRYWKRDDKGKIRFDPSQSLETWQEAINPLPDIAGLRYVLPKLLALPTNLVSAAQRERWQRMLSEMPPIPIGNGKFLPAEKASKGGNVENTELYAIYPFRLYGVGKENLMLARDTYQARKGGMRNMCWNQDVVQAALLGLAEQAGTQLVARANYHVNRFPGFVGTIDGSADQDHFNNLIVALHFMLLQYDPPTATSGGKIYLCPAWPKTWNASFRLHAPLNTILEGEVRDGKVVGLKVTPPLRAADVVNMLEKKE